MPAVPKPSPLKGGTISSAYDSPTFKLDMSIRVDAPVGAMSISPSSRDVVLASRQGLHIVDLDNPYDPPRFLQHITAYSVADVQWSPHASHAHWVVSTSNQRAIVWNLALPSTKAIEHVLQSHTRAITDINFSAHDPNVLATCSIDSFVHCWDLRIPRRPVISFADWTAAATQVKYNRQNPNILASAHDRYLYIWDTRMGAKEVRKINAHSTKIYGLDWNRTRPTGIITCALDKSVRFWDYEYAPNDTPERIIHTSFPVWRARHTPFGWGVLTMPQRGDTSLYLWDRRAKDSAQTQPVAKFEGHTDNVKEFLWRWRGGDREDGTDNREFQLVTWGLDKDIRLWDISMDTMAKIGHDPSKKLRFRITRKGAKYVTYRNEAEIVKRYTEGFADKDSTKQPPPKLTLTSDGARIRKDGLILGQRSGLAHGIGQLNGNVAKNDDRRFERALTGAREGGFMRVGRTRPAEIGAIAWMKGVKIARKVSESGLDGSRSSARGDFPVGWDAPENLGDEISYVGSKFHYINFEKVNIAARTCTVSLTGPWGTDNDRIFIRVDVSFPQDYPMDGHSIPEFTVERSNNISDGSIESIDTQLKKIASTLVSRRRVCLEAFICFLLGERVDNSAFIGSDDEDESSTDDEEIVNTNVIGDEEEGLNNLINSTKQASVPLPKSCGAVWSSTGLLVSFFPPKEERMGKSLLSSLAAREGDRSMIRMPGGGKLWEGFGRLYLANPPKGDTDVEGDSDDGSFSSDDTSDADTDLHHSGPLRPNFGWRLQGNPSLTRGLGRRGGSTDRSTQRSTGTGVRTATTVTAKPKSVVSLRDFSEMLPARIDLAEEYQVGEGAGVCKHNATVAEKHGFKDYADVWRLVEMILSDDVPLEVLNPPRDRLRDAGDAIMIMARRASLDRGRRDSGLDLVFDDEDMDFPDSEFRGRIKWGNHPMGGRWLVEQLFEYFEKKADIQMLAMLSCVLSEKEDKGNKPDLPNVINIPPFKRQPSYSRDYYPSVEYLEQFADYNLSTSPSRRSMVPAPPMNSFGSSVGIPMVGSDPIVPYSTGTTPPSNNMRMDAWANVLSVSASPEQHHNPLHNYRRMAPSINRYPSNSSPPLKKRPSPAEGMLPFPSGVTWGAITTFGSGSKAPSDTMTDSSIGDIIDPINITMANTALLDDLEPMPLLSPPRRALCKSYRETYADLLYTWKLPIARLEVLKFSNIDANPPSSPLLLPSDRRSDKGLEIAGLCSKCGGFLDVTQGARGECKACKRRQVTMTCTVCEVIVKGLYGMCSKCGHIGHWTCHREWFMEEKMCPTGCGCECSSIDEGLDSALDEVEPEVLLRAPTVEAVGQLEGWGAYEGEYLW